MKEFLASKMVSCRIKIGNRPLSYSDKELWEKVSGMENMDSSSGRANISYFPKGEWDEIDDITGEMLKCRSRHALATVDSGVYLMTPEQFVSVRDRLRELNAERVKLAEGRDWDGAVAHARAALNGRFDEKRYDRDKFIGSFTLDARIDRHPKADELLSTYSGAVDQLVEEAKSGMAAKYGELEAAARDGIARRLFEPLSTLHDKLAACKTGDAKRFADSLFDNVWESYNDVVAALPDCSLRDRLGALAMPVMEVMREKAYKESFKECPSTVDEPAKQIVALCGKIETAINEDMPEKVAVAPKLTGLEMLAKVFA